MPNPRPSTSYPPGSDPYRRNCPQSIPEANNPTERIPKKTPKDHTSTDDETTSKITHRGTHTTPLKRFSPDSQDNPEDRASYFTKGRLHGPPSVWCEIRTLGKTLIRGGTSLPRQFPTPTTILTKIPTLSRTKTPEEVDTPEGTQTVSSRAQARLRKRCKRWKWSNRLPIEKDRVVFLGKS